MSSQVLLSCRDSFGPCSLAGGGGGRGRGPFAHFRLDSEKDAPCPIFHSLRTGCVSLQVWMMSGSVTAAWHLCCFSDGVMFVASGREKQLLRVEGAVRLTVSKQH